jgi:cation:H+ antiporter
LLILGSNWLIQGSVKLSILFKLSPLFIGLILIAFGTSAPEAAIGIIAALRDQKGIALGNIIGSNISNIGLILGLCALVMPLGVNKRIFKLEIPIMLASVALFYFLSLDLLISRIDGLIFIGAFIAFCVSAYYGAKKSFDHAELEGFKLKKILQKLNSRFFLFTIILASLAVIVWGANLMVKAGVDLATIFGVNPWIIGITIFAIGSSLPELAASLTASLKKVPSISVGNIVGSNIFNILFVMGIVALIRPITLESSVLGFEFPVLIIFSFALFIVMRIGYKISRLRGLFLFLGYITFIFFLLKRWG